MREIVKQCRWNGIASFVKQLRSEPAAGRPGARARLGLPTILRVLTSKIVGCHRGAVRDIAVIEDPAAAEVSLDPVRARLLAELAEPASATMVAARLGLPRQKVNYHLRAL